MTVIKDDTDGTFCVTVQVINDQSRVLCDEVLLPLADGQEIDIFPLVLPRAPTTPR